MAIRYTDPHHTHVEHQDVAQTENVIVDSPTSRNLGVFRFQQAIYLLFSVIEGLIAIRFCLLLLGANPATPFVSAMYAITGPFVAPFVGIFGTPRFQGSVFEPHSLVALVIYALLSWVLAQIVWLALADTSANVATRTSTVRSETEHEREHHMAA